MAIRQTIQAGHPALKRNNKTISDPASPIIKNLIKDLTDTLYKAELIGIAAPQIAENYQVFVTHARNTKARKLGKEDVFRVFINPKITDSSKETIIIYEGCGSVVEGDLFGPVRRPKEIEVTALDEAGQKFSLRCDGILARVIQHEIDHLNGIEFMQKVEDYSQIMVGKYYQERIKGSGEQMKLSKITVLKYLMLS